MNARTASTEELRDAEIAAIARRHAEATRTNILTGNERVLHDMANAVGDRLSMNKWCELLVRSALSVGPIGTGTLFVAVLEECIKADAEAEATKEVERMERAALADPDNCKPTTRQ